MALRSFIDVSPDSAFPIQNLPYGIFKPRDGTARAGVAIGELILDLSVLEELGHFRDITEQQIFSGGSLNAFMAMGRPAWKKTRAILQNLLSADNGALRDNSELREHAFHKQSEVTMQLPARVGDYTDFYSSYHHAHNVGTMLRGPENALMPNWKWLPVAYHGRASSIVVSGTEVKRPHGQTKPADASAPVFGSSKSLDFELETRLQTARMREPQTIMRTNFQNLYWSIAQQLAHHTVNGCNVQPGDLLASGTISGPTGESRGCMLELTWRGQNPLKLPDAEARKWLEDGDTLSITGWCQGEGYRVGFGEVSGRIVGA